MPTPTAFQQRGIGADSKWVLRSFLNTICFFLTLFRNGLYQCVRSMVLKKPQCFGVVSQWSTALTCPRGMEISRHARLARSRKAIPHIESESKFQVFTEIKASSQKSMFSQITTKTQNQIINQHVHFLLLLSGIHNMHCLSIQSLIKKSFSWIWPPQCFQNQTATELSLSKGGQKKNNLVYHF